MFTNIKTIVVAIGTLLMVMGFVGTLAAKPSGGALDGQAYTIKVWAEGDTKTGPDNLSFTNGKFFSSDCEQYGFEHVDYKASKQADKVVFEAKVSSAKEGTIHWKGEVKGKAVSGSFKWVKKGQKTITYLFEGTRK